MQWVQLPCHCCSRIVSIVQLQVFFGPSSSYMTDSDRSSGWWCLTADPEVVGSRFDGGKRLGVWAFIFRCTLKTTRWIKFLEPSTMVCLIHYMVGFARKIPNIIIMLKQTIILWWPSTTKKATFRRGTRTSSAALACPTPKCSLFYCAKSP